MDVKTITLLLPTTSSRSNFHQLNTPPKMDITEQVKTIAIEAIKAGLADGKIKINFPASAIRDLVKTEAPAIAKAEADKAVASLSQALKNFETQQVSFGEALRSQMAEIAKSNSQAPCQEIKIISQHKTKKLEGLFHCQFSDVVKRLQVNAQIKRGVWLHGAAGGGKTTLAIQAAEALDVKFVPIFGSPTLTDTKLLGYTNAGTGDFVKGSIYDAYACTEAQERGALLFIDEADAGEFMLVLNALLANDYYRFSNGEVLHRPKRFYILAAANTLGTGSQGGYRRATLDLASRDRFTPYQLNYDEALETKVAGNPPVSKWIFAARKWIHDHIQGGNLTPRTHFAAAAYHAAGIPDAHAEAIAPTLSPDNWKALKAACPAFPALATAGA